MIGRRDLWLNTEGTLDRIDAAGKHTVRHPEGSAGGATGTERPAAERELWIGKAVAEPRIVIEIESSVLRSLPHGAGKLPEAREGLREVKCGSNVERFNKRAIARVATVVVVHPTAQVLEVGICLNRLARVSVGAYVKEINTAAGKLRRAALNGQERGENVSLLKCFHGQSARRCCSHAAPRSLLTVRAAVTMRKKRSKLHS